MERTLEMLAGGRVAWGALALAAPGLGYLLSDPRARRRWRRLCLMVDACDTAAGLAHVVRGDVPRGPAAGLTAITGGYAVLGALALRAEGTPV
jgi:hypothetical protein